MTDNYRILLTQEQIQERIKELGAQITKDYKDNPPVIICMLKGAIYFFADLTRHIDLPLTFDFARLSSYKNGTSSGEMELISNITTEIKDKDILSYVKSDNGKYFHAVVSNERKVGTISSLYTDDDNKTIVSIGQESFNILDEFLKYDSQKNSGRASADTQ